MKKKIFIILLTVVVSLTSVESAQANDSSLIIKSGVSLHQKEYDSISEYVTKWFEVNGYGKHVLSDPIELYSLGNEKVAMMYSVDQMGYVIVNLINYDIMEFAFDSRPNVRFDGKTVYNGFFELYEETNGKVLQQGESLTLNNRDDFWGGQKDISKRELSDKMADLKLINEGSGDYHRASSNRNGFMEYGSLSNTLPTWTSTFFCQVHAAAIVLRYWYDKGNTDFLPQGFTQNNLIQYYLCSFGYLMDTILDSESVIYGNLVYNIEGLNNYLLSRNLYSHGGNAFNEYNFYLIKSLIDSDIPVVCGVNPSLLGTAYMSRHAVIAHAYHVGYDGVPYLEVNNGKGSNGIVINASSYYHGQTDMWYLY